MGGSLAATGFPQATTLAAYDMANELTTWNGTTITPDANGNILNDGVAAYTWNARNQLISRGSANFEYDSYGRRIFNASGNNLLYEGWNVSQELSGTTPTANRILGGIDEFFSRADSTGQFSPLTDALGSTLALTNSSGNITTQYGYDPYGNTTGNGSSSTNVFQYTGRENDGNGLYSYRSRYYSPTLGRFISEDAIGFAGGPNLYRYANADPVGNRDPFGRDTGQFGVGGQLTVGVVAGTAGGGIAGDDQGNVGLYLTLGGGAGTGAGGSAGLQGAWSSGQDINDLSGWFTNVSVGGGAGAGGSADTWGGSTDDGRQVFGGGGTYGIGGGAGSFAGKTFTWVVPLPVTAGRFCLPSNAGVPGQVPTGAGTYYVPEPEQAGW